MIISKREPLEQQRPAETQQPDSRPPEQPKKAKSLMDDDDDIFGGAPTPVQEAKIKKENSA